MSISNEHLQTLHAIANCVVPPDETPGAGEAGDLAYLVDVMTGEYANQLETLGRFLDTLDITTHSLHQCRFADLGAAAQTALLNMVENESIFQTLVTLVQEGYWASAAGLATVGFEVSG